MDQVLMIIQQAGLIRLDDGQVTVQTGLTVKPKIIMDALQVVGMIEQSFGMLAFKDTSQPAQAAVASTNGLAYVHKEHKHRI